MGTPTFMGHFEPTKISFYCFMPSCIDFTTSSNSFTKNVFLSLNVYVGTCHHLAVFGKKLMSGNAQDDTKRFIHRQILTRNSPSSDQEKQRSPPTCNSYSGWPPQLQVQ